MYQITHHGHSCVSIEKEGTKILLDPGKFAFDVNGKQPEDFTGIGALLLTHEHADHTDPEIIAKIMAVNPGCVIYTNSSIIKILREKGIAAQILAPGSETVVGSMNVKAIDCPHGSLPVPVPESTGFLIDGIVLDPSDSLDPRPLPEGIRVLLAPACAPWMTANDAIAFVEKIKPEIVMPIHTAVWRYDYLVERLFVNVLREKGYRVETETINLEEPK